MTKGRLASRPAKPGRQGGSVAVEFALVFMLFFTVMYAIVSYGVVFAIKHSLTQAANEGARAAVKDVGGLADRVALAQTTATQAIAWLGAKAPTPVVTTPPCPGASAFVCVDVALTYNYASNPIIPPFPGLGLAMPASISAHAIVQLAAVS